MVSKRAICLDKAKQQKGFCYFQSPKCGYTPATLLPGGFPLPTAAPLFSAAPAEAKRGCSRQQTASSHVLRAYPTSAPVLWKAAESDMASTCIEIFRHGTWCEFAVVFFFCTWPAWRRSARSHRLGCPCDRGCACKGHNKKFGIGAQDMCDIPKRVVAARFSSTI